MHTQKTSNGAGRSIPRKRALCAWLTSALAALIVPQAAVADENYPTKPIRVIVGMAPGGATDVLARILAEKMGPSLGQPMVVENRPGAGSIIGTDALAKSPADGYTLSVLLSNAVIGNQFLYSQLPYNPNTDVTLVYQLVDAATVLAVSSDQPYRSAKEFADFAQGNPDQVIYGSFSPGSYGHVAMAYLDERLQSKMTHVGYKGESAMVQDMLGGRIHVGFGSVANMNPHVESGRLHYLGVSGPKRMAALPDVPTLAEQGLNDEPFKLFGWLALVAPAGTPKPIIDRLAAETSKALQAPGVQDRVRALGFEPVLDSTPEKLQARYAHDLPIWKSLIERSGAKIQ